MKNDWLYGDVCGIANGQNAHQNDSKLDDSAAGLDLVITLCVQGRVNPNIPSRRR